MENNGLSSNMENNNISPSMENNDISSNIENNSISPNKENNVISSIMENNDISPNNVILSNPEDNDISSNIENNVLSVNMENNIISSNIESNVISSKMESSNMETNRENNVISSNIENNIISSNMENSVISSNMENNVISSNMENNVISSNIENNVISSNMENNIISSNLENNVTSSNIENNIISSNMENSVISSNMENNITSSNMENNVISSNMDNRVISSMLLGINDDLQRTIDDIQRKLEEEEKQKEEENATETFAALFDMGFGFTSFLRLVFLHVGVADLLSCKLVCWQWKEFIEAEVWWRHPLVRNYWRWTAGVSSLVEVDCGGEVSHIASDGVSGLVVCAMKAGSILVVNKETFFVLAVLQSEAGQVWQVGVSSSIIVAVTAEQVIVWKCSTFQLVARVRHGSKFQPYLRVREEAVVVPGANRHVTRLLVYKGHAAKGGDNERSLVALREFSHGTFWVLDAAIDRCFVLTLALFAYGTITTRELRLWNGMDGQCLRTCDLGGGVAGTISLQYPHAAVSSGTKALAVWDMDTGKCLRKLQTSASGVEIRGQFLYIVDKSAQVRMFRMREMCGDAQLWQREFYHGNQGPSKGSTPAFTVSQDRIMSLSSNKNRRNVLTVMQLYSSLQEATSKVQ